MNNQYTLQQLENIGNTIKQHRKECGLTQLALANKVGCTQSEVSKVESGRKPAVTMAMIIRICKELDIDFTMKTTPQKP